MDVDVTSDCSFDKLRYWTAISLLLMPKTAPKHSKFLTKNSWPFPVPCPPLDCHHPSRAPTDPKRKWWNLEGWWVMKVHVLEMLEFQCLDYFRLINEVKVNGVVLDWNGHGPQPSSRFEVFKLIQVLSNVLICDVIYMLRKQPRTKKTCSDETFRNGHFNCPFGNGQKLLSAEGLGMSYNP